MACRQCGRSGQMWTEDSRFCSASCRSRFYGEAEAAPREKPATLNSIVHNVLLDHYGRYHHGRDAGSAETFADTFGEKLGSAATRGPATQAADNVWIDELPYVSPGADENYRLAGVLREALCREIRRWLEGSGVWRYNIKEKSLAYARAVAIAADFGTYMTALQNAKLGQLPADPYDDLPEHERAAVEAERRHQEGWKWR